MYQILTLLPEESANYSYLPPPPLGFSGVVSEMLPLPLSLPGPFINLDFDPPTGHVSNSHSPPKVMSLSYLPNPSARLLRRCISCSLYLFLCLGLLLIWDIYIPPTGVMYQILGLVLPTFSFYPYLPNPEKKNRLSPFVVSENAPFTSFSAWTFY